MENNNEGLRKLTCEMFTDRAPATRALPGVFRRLRERRGWSQNRLAKESRVSRTMLGYVEAETHVPTAETMARVAGALGLSLGQFCAEVDEWLAGQPAPCQRITGVAMETVSLGAPVVPKDEFHGITTKHLPAKSAAAPQN